MSLQQQHHPQKNVRDQESCPECNGQLIYNDDEHFCEVCGLVVARDEIDHGPEWRSFDGEDDAKRRVGPPRTHLRHDRGLETQVGTDAAVDRGSFSGSKRRRLRRMTRLNRQAKDKVEHRLIYAFKEITRMGTALGLPDDVQERAGILHRKTVEAGLLQGRSVESFATAALHIAARDRGYPRPVEEVLNVSQTTSNRLWTAIHVFQRELDIGTPPADPRDYLPKFLDELEEQAGSDFDSEVVLRTAVALLETAITENYHSGNSPTGLASGAIYAAGEATGNKLTQAAVAEVCETSAPTLREHYRQLLRLNTEIEVEENQ